MAIDGVCTLDVADFPPLPVVEKRRRSFSLLLSSLMIVGFSRKSGLYRQLPHQPLELSVLKLDGSCFDIRVKRSATVAELKGAVEAKLIDDTGYIAKLGIKDGDQLQFVRHVTTGYNVIRKQSKKGQVSPKLHNRTSSLSRNYDQDDIESGRIQHHGNNQLFKHHEPKMVVFLGGWFSHIKLASAGKTCIESLVRSSGTQHSLVHGFKNLIQLCRQKQYYQKVSKRKRSILAMKLEFAFEKKVK
ncbi:hypothetical protein SDJN02_05840, partial [Cucurbita argyrosperma subsp. argyrosperma]